MCMAFINPMSGMYLSLCFPEEGRLMISGATFSLGERARGTKSSGKKREQGAARWRCPSFFSNYKVAGMSGFWTTT